jgi:hypothetical protein
VVALFFFVCIFSNHASYILEKYSDFCYNETMTCRHVYEYVGSDVCPDCGGYTHEPDHEFHNQLHKQWIADGKHLIMQCPLGGTIRGWWDI